MSNQCEWCGCHVLQDCNCPPGSPPRVTWPDENAAKDERLALLEAVAAAARELHYTLGDMSVVNSTHEMHRVLEECRRRREALFQGLLALDRASGTPASGRDGTKGEGQ